MQASESKANAVVDGRRHQKRVQGVVVSDKMQKTIVVRSEWRLRHDLYEKIVSHRTKYKAHDEKGQAKIGDIVEIAECRPLSKTKNWRLVRVVRRGSGITEAVAGVEELSTRREGHDKDGSQASTSKS